jgi:hypothetical protein
LSARHLQQVRSRRERRQLRRQTVARRVDRDAGERSDAKLRVTNGNGRPWPEVQPVDKDRRLIR